MIDESWYRKPEGVKEETSAGGVVARVVEGRVCAALVGAPGQRACILPKGKVEDGESLEDTARREIREEAGFSDLTLLGKLGVCERLNAAKTAWKTAHYFLFTTGQAFGIPTDTTRLYIQRWFPIDGPLPMLWPDQKELILSNRDRILVLVREASDGGSSP